jgi:HEAT repeat protein
VKTLRNTALAAVLASEGISAIALLRGAGAPAFVLHVIACGWGAALMHRRVLEGPARWSFALVFAGTLFMPLVGMLGAIAVALLTPSGTMAAEPDHVQTRIPRPPDAEEAPASSDPDSQAGGRKVRIEALTALRSRSDPDAILLLRQALEDPDEDVRLLAHSLLESKNRTACRGIDAVSAALDEAAEVRRGPLHRRLACQYWELAWLGLVQGECLDHALRSARHHAISALERDPDCSSLHLLLGRIELRLGCAERAELALDRCRALGVPEGVVGPYLAEAAFFRRRFDLVRSHLTGCGASGSAGAAAILRRYWS